MVSTDVAAALAAAYVRIHNEAAVEYKAAFAEVGARMWHGDYAHPLKPSNRDFIAEQMRRFDAAGVRAVYGAAATHPLTVLDSYPEVTAEQWRALKAKVANITEQHNTRWNAVLTGYNI